MGLFDEIKCEYPLPDGWVPPPDTWFQTKDTEDQYLVRLTLGADGRLRRKSGEDLMHHGAVVFYTSNWSGSAPWGVMTSDDKPWWSAEYVALYDHGALLKIEGRYEVGDPSTSRWLPRAEWHRLDRERDAESARTRSLESAREREGGKDGA